MQFYRELSKYSVVRERSETDCLVHRQELALLRMNEATVHVTCEYERTGVELIGIEPMTPGLQSRCSPS